MTDETRYKPNVDDARESVSYHGELGWRADWSKAWPDVWVYSEENAAAQRDAILIDLMRRFS